MNPFKTLSVFHFSIMLLSLKILFTHLIYTPQQGKGGIQGGFNK